MFNGISIDELHTGQTASNTASILQYQPPRRKLLNPTNGTYTPETQETISLPLERSDLSRQQRRREKENRKRLLPSTLHTNGYHSVDEVELETKTSLEVKIENNEKVDLARAMYIASNTLKHAHNQIRPTKGFVEYGLLIPFAILAGLASASTSKSFGENSISTIESNTAHVPLNVETILNNIVFVPALLTQLSFAANSNINLDIKIKRYLETASTEELSNVKWQIVKALIIVAPSAIPTFIMGLNALSPYLTDSLVVLLYTVCLLRSCAALGMNGDFYTQNEKNKQGHKKIPLIELLLNLQKHIDHLVSHEGNKLIKLLSDSGVLKDIDSIHTASPETHVHLLQTILNKLVHLFPEVYSQKITRQQEENVNTIYAYLKKPFTKRNAAIAFGMYASLINLSAALTVPSHLGLPKPNDLIGVFSALEFNNTALGFACLLGLSIGIPSYYVNFLINSTAVSKFINKISAIKTRGWRLEYNNNLFRFVTTVCLSFLYGLSVGGSSAIYAFIDAKFARFLNMILNTFVFTAIGSMAFDGAYKGLINLWYYITSNRYAFAADNLYDYYTTELHAEPYSPETNTPTSNNSSSTPDELLLDINEVDSNSESDINPNELPKHDKYLDKRTNLISVTGTKMTLFIGSLIERIDYLSPSDQTILETKIIKPETHARILLEKPQDSTQKTPRYITNNANDDLPIEYRDAPMPATNSSPFQSIHKRRTHSIFKKRNSQTISTLTFNGSPNIRPSIPSLDLSKVDEFRLFSTPMLPAYKHPTLKKSSSSSLAEISQSDSSSEHTP